MLHKGVKMIDQYITFQYWKEIIYTGLYIVAILGAIGYTLIKWYKK